MSKFVEGSYLSIEEAQKAIDVLVSQGYAERDITLVTNSSVKDSISLNTDVEVTTDYSEASDTEDDRSMWDKIKDVFTVDTYDETSYDSPDYNRDEDVLYNYKDDIDNGNIIVLVEDDPNIDRSNVDVTDADTLDTSSPTAVPPVVDPTPLPGEGIMPDPNLVPDDNVVADPGAVPEVDPSVEEDPLLDTDTENRSMDDEERIKLQEERLDVDTNEVQTGEVNIKKNITEETKTVEVPVQHEEVTIERRPVTDNEPTDGTLGDEEEITIPIKEEQIEVTKRPVVTDEVVVNKETKEETKEVSETVRKEDLDVDTQGDVTVENDDDLKRP
ncbi:YsnF/AvaK domain-containing protein [Desemzia sp. RIT804]|uniref:YsnF/AvaK domain-containing protein n=1 Tax=Desemzia sp. RIT 804 TaxID=2810209 RepID=UPI001950126C|nr:YsnF/AvaK domain-containing protein [Desemzia sp. RIT 804]MBM6615938.1 YsnF/AvaK domain-containing protein [Desemzia sp. RIT 804]